MTSRPSSPIRLRGKPRRIEAMVSVATEPTFRRAKLRSVGVEKQKEQRELSGRVQIFSVGPGVLQLESSVPDTTPPGEYRVEIEWGEDCMPAEVIVEPFRRMEIKPRSFSLAISPGSSSEHELALVNVGNVPIEIPKVHAFGISLDNIIGDSFAATYRSNTKGNDRVGQFADELAARYAMVRLVIKKPDAPFTLAPGQFEGNVVAELKWPDKIEPGVYSGTWPLGPASVGFTVEVAPKAPARRSTK